MSVLSINGFHFKSEEIKTTSFKIDLNYDLCKPNVTSHVVIPKEKKLDSRHTAEETLWRGELNEQMIDNECSPNEMKTQSLPDISSDLKTASIGIKKRKSAKKKKTKKNKVTTRDDTNYEHSQTHKLPKHGANRSYNNEMSRRMPQLCCEKKIITDLPCTHKPGAKQEHLPCLLTLDKGKVKTKSLNTRQISPVVAKSSPLNSRRDSIDWMKRNRESNNFYCPPTTPYNVNFTLPWNSKTLLEIMGQREITRKLQQIRDRQQHHQNMKERMKKKEAAKHEKEAGLARKEQIRKEVYALNKAMSSYEKQKFLEFQAENTAVPI